MAQASFAVKRLGGLWAIPFGMVLRSGSFSVPNAGVSVIVVLRAHRDKILQDSMGFCQQDEIL